LLWLLIHSPLSIRLVGVCLRSFAFPIFANHADQRGVFRASDQITIPGSILRGTGRNQQRSRSRTDPSATVNTGSCFSVIHVMVAISENSEPSIQLKHDRIVSTELQSHISQRGTHLDTLSDNSFGFPHQKTSCCGNNLVLMQPSSRFSI
jgi:hypothetical protein